MKVLRDLGALRLIEATERDYAAVFEFSKSAGLDLETYDYMVD